MKNVRHFIPKEKKNTKVYLCNVISKMPKEKLKKIKMYIIYLNMLPT